ncbi:MAG: cache domain-containing protein [Bacteroidales bacterium]|nr:cache domain-containing protein [Bacteroidales bacterium]
MRIRAKIFLFIFITSFIVFAAVIGYIVFNYRNYSIKEANRLANIYATHASSYVKNTLEKDMAVCQTLSQGFIDYDKIPASLREQIYKDVLKNVLKGHPEYLSVWMSWELRFIEPGYTKKYGRKRTVTVRESGVVNFYVDTIELSGDSYGSGYYESKISGEDVLMDPYYYVYSQTEGGDSILETSVAKPIIIDGEFAGIVGIDLTLGRFQEIIQGIKPFENSYAMLISNSGVIISSPEENNVGDSLLQKFPQLSNFDVLNKIKSGTEFSDNFADSTGFSNYVSFSPIKVGNSKNSWSVCLIVPANVVEKEAIGYFNRSILIAIIGILLFSIITLIIAQRLTIPLKQTTSILKDLDKGIIDFSKKLKVRSRDELAEMGRSLNNLMDTLYKTAEFAKKIGQGDFNAQYKSLSEHDVLGNALVDMQKNLQVGQEQDEINQLERRKITWAQDGLSELGEVLRNSTEKFEDYLLNILSQIIRYVKAEQGAIFLLNNDNPVHQYLELRSAYAYNKKKALESQMEIGEGLVGRCFQEKEVIYMTNIPEGYTFVSSGLGGHEPRCLFLMPLLFEDEPFGVIELASLHELADYEIEFLKSIGERVASSVSVTAKNVQTKELLEQYRIQSEELHSREQMLQENLKELQKIQEDASTKEKETTGIIEALAGIGSIVWYDMQGNILNIRDKNLADAGLSEKELIGKNQRNYAPEAIENPEEYQRFWDELRAGITRRRLFTIDSKRGKIWISEIYTPITDNSGNFVKVVNIGFDITEQKILEEKIEKLQEELEKLKNKK